MAQKVGPAIFEDHISIELIPGKWTDTFVFPTRHDRMLSPWAYAEAVKTVFQPLRKLRRSGSLWVPVIAPGKWYFDEIKYALRKAPIPVAVTQDRSLPELLNFSKPPGIYDVPCPGAEPLDTFPGDDLPGTALRSLLQMARFTVAFTNEIECSLMIASKTSLIALRTLAARGYIEYHPDDGDIDAHLNGRQSSLTARRGKIIRWNGQHWPYWRIKRQGLSVALRAWGVPAGMNFDYRLEKTRLLNSPHRRRSRQWPKWVRMALPHAQIYAGWNEVSVPGLRVRPDALAWGNIDQAETLFWLEIESGNVSWRVAEEKTAIRWEKATSYAQAAGVHLIFVVLAPRYVRQGIRLAFTHVPPTCAVILSDWKRNHFGTLPFPKWGEVVME
jgi:hypothetical protein